MFHIISIYGIVAVTRVVMQIITANLERSKQTKNIVNIPKAAMIVSVYNEPVEVFDKAAKSWTHQVGIGKLQIVVVDDGSTNSVEIRSVCQKYDIQYIYQTNAGKREGMYKALKHVNADVEVILTSDSDTQWHHMAAYHLIKTLYQNDTVGAVTGEVAVRNTKDNLLTRLISIRYHLAFTQERASQSYFNVVSCVSGPLGAYRRDIIEKVKYDFITQTFLGQKCTYGDDRHLTNLVLNEGYKVKYSPLAICYTEAPKDMITLMKQQTRWAKSYWREAFWQLRVLPKHSIYLAYDWAVQLVMPFILLHSVVYYLGNAIGGNIEYIGLLALTITLMGLLRIAEPMLRTGNFLYLMFPLYAFGYVFIMLPIKFWALLTISTGKWGTR